MKHQQLHHDYVFTPIGCETFGAWGEEATQFLKFLGKRIKAESQQPRSFEFLMQRLSITIQ